MNWSAADGLRRRMALALVATLAGYVVLLAPAFWLLPSVPALAVSAAVLCLVAVLALRADRVVRLVTAPVAVDREDYPDLVDALDRLASQAGVPRPRVALIPGYEANAMSVGSGRRATIFVTAGLVNELDDDELEAVLAHELAHLANRDSAVLTVAGFPAAVAVSLLGAAKQHLNGWAYLFGYVLVLAGLVLIALPLLVASLPGTLALSRYREYAADRGAVALTGDPTALVSALETLHDADADPPATDARRLAGLGAFCFVPERDTSLSLPATHPPVAKRIRRLREIQRGLESAGSGPAAPSDGTRPRPTAAADESD